MEYVLFFVGLGFFIYIIWKVEASEERVYQRKLNEQREFGYRNQQTKHRKDTPDT